MPETHYVIFIINDQFFAVAASEVERIIRAVQPAYPLDAPDLLIGLINIGGDMIPLIDIRKQFGLPERSIRTSDRFIIAEIGGHRAAFAVDAVIGVNKLQPEPAMAPESIYPEMRQYISGVATFENRTVLIYALDFLIPHTTIEQVSQVPETAK